MAERSRPLAVVTGASTGIGFELSKCCAEHGFDLVISADEPAIQDSARALRELGVSVEALEVDLATAEGVDMLCDAVGGRAVEVLIANAGRGLGKAFLDQDFKQVQRVVDTNVSGTIYLIHRLGNQMRTRGRGRILITGSIAGFMPGAFQAVYNGTKSFLDSFSLALRSELSTSGVSVTCLMPGPTETEFFERADLMDTRMGQMRKDDPATVAKIGFQAMMDGKGDVLSGWQNRLQAAIARILPAGATARMHRKFTEPGSAKP